MGRQKLRVSGPEDRRQWQGELRDQLPAGRCRRQKQPGKPAPLARMAKPSLTCTRQGRNYASPVALQALRLRE